MIDRDPAALADAYQNARPFPHIMIDDFFPPERIEAVTREIAAARIDPEAPGYGWFGKRRASDLETFPPETRRLVEEMNGPEFIRWLEQVTGIQGLEPDPYLEGGGIHQTPAGGFLKIHTDFNWHRRLERHRRVNILLYLNEDWDENWGGSLELWDEKDINAPDGRPGARIAPLLNRLVIFSTTDFSYHGHPHKLTCPPDRTRNSIALYYYSKERPQEEIKFGHSEMTNYRARHEEEGLGLKHKAHQLMLRSPRVRKLIDKVRRARG
ncbi:MAG TPA: 2OG-Fe(II) oxygenase [Allosphingosinicella sp.]